MYSSTSSSESRIPVMRPCKMNRRRARSDVLWWLASFLALQAGFNIALETRLEGMRDPEYVTRIQLLRQAIKSDPQRPAVVAFGSSRVLLGLRPELISNDVSRPDSQPFLFNFSHTGYGPTHNYVVMKHLLRDGIRPRGVVLELAPMQLAQDVCQQDYLDFLHLSQNDLANYVLFRDTPSQVYREWLGPRVLPWYSFRFNVLDRCLPTWVPPKSIAEKEGWKALGDYGWLPALGSIHEPSSKALGNARKSYETVLQDFRLAPINKKAVQLIIDLCKKEKIPLAVLLTPEGPTFRSWYSSQANDVVHAFLDELRKDNAVQVFDARSWFDTEDYFWDSHHLLPEGAAEFTKRFAREVLPHFSADAHTEHARAKNN